MRKLLAFTFAVVIPFLSAEQAGGDGDPLAASLVEQLALREEKVMKQLSAQASAAPSAPSAPPPIGYKVVTKPGSGSGSGPGPDRTDGPLAGAAPGNEVSETDLYLLGAIERLAYRLDLMDRRMRRAEELLYHIMEGQGATTHRHDPCPGNFTRVSRNCYHFSERQFNWKGASSMCRSLGANLIELETRDEFAEFVTFLQADPTLRGAAQWWTGGLNPGLLWIWAGSGRPVLPKRPTSRPEDSVRPGRVDGRCLQLAPGHQSRVYQYEGTDCGARARYVCELEENATGRALTRIHKSLELP